MVEIKIQDNIDDTEDTSIPKEELEKWYVIADEEEFDDDFKTVETNKEDSSETDETQKTTDNVVAMPSRYDKNNQEEETILIEDDELLEDEDDLVTVDIEELLSRIEELEAENSLLIQRHERVTTDWSNYKRRTEETRTQERLNANENIVKVLLPVLDDLERVIQHSNDEADAAGVSAVYRKLIAVLEKEGVTQIAPVDGESYDVSLHQAFEKVPVCEGKETDTVCQTYQKGYSINGKNIRPAIVSVYC